MKVLVAILSVFTMSLSFLAHASETVGCFSAGKTNVKFFQISQDGLDIGYVKFEHSKSAIPLLFVKTEEQDSTDRPSSFTTDWNEMLNGKVNGYYTVMLQGARFYQFDYKSLKGKVTEFSENIGAYNDDRSDCVWK
ncbi:hypothetical protein F3I27_03670 [Pantoea sp. Bo_2]|uniref:hypothetical protein n=1 Tax=unclassified Pantoea TaxID=2630326 RepID=UPI001232AC31|nr:MULTISPECIES: hypothetical protein [unclassified Pantoea]KAA5934723.1 hypothetical protein F3I57_23595 [Pantoea sp. VH_3]KAA5944135.1 hypothetical protein F3I56_23675 [Pantoea sp. VH_25]KAA5975543.1 hypothetical protein F3I48_23710 [Pantoea sp. M_3]KAA6049859.1 hypothetical protein F3I36_03675 [Pantoea sp. FN_2b]KAA6054659.1 hypothetical protein F3I34_03670 [Pantoea sp. Bo_5]